MKRGFTLIELLVVIAIIGVLAAILIPNLMSGLSQSKQVQTESLIKTVRTPMDEYAKRNRGRYPGNDPNDMTETLVTELERLSLHSFSENEIGPNPQGGGDVVMDGWGEPIRYHQWVGEANKAGAHNTRTYDMWSAGEDLDIDTWEDNVANWRIDRQQ